jgi:hypothetical protein
MASEEAIVLFPDPPFCVTNAIVRMLSLSVGNSELPHFKLRSDAVQNLLIREGTLLLCFRRVAELQRVQCDKIFGSAGVTQVDVACFSQIFRSGKCRRDDRLSWMER